VASGGELYVTGKPNSVLAFVLMWTQNPISKRVRRPTMAWKTPKIVEVPVGMEINMYACAARK